jgi:D-Tyr-tRNAtyr deacylase
MTPVQMFLAACAAALALTLAWMTDWGQGFTTDDVDVKTSASKLDPATVLPDFKLSAEQNAYAQISERPLLSPTRRPAPTQAVAAVAPEPPKPQIRRGLYQLLGVSDYGDVKVAQVREVATSRVKTVRTGDTLQEMTVSKIEATQVALKFLEETDVLEMAKFTASARVPQGPSSTFAQAQPPQAAVNPLPPPQLPPGGPPPTPFPATIPGVPLSVVQSSEPPTANAPAPDAAARGRTSMRERLGIGRTPPN